MHGGDEHQSMQPRNTTPPGMPLRGYLQREFDFAGQCSRTVALMAPLFDGQHTFCNLCNSASQ